MVISEVVTSAVMTSEMVTPEVMTSEMMTSEVMASAVMSSKVVISKVMTLEVMASSAMSSEVVTSEVMSSEMVTPEVMSSGVMTSGVAPKQPGLAITSWVTLDNLPTHCTSPSSPANEDGYPGKSPLSSLIKHRSRVRLPPTPRNLTSGTSQAQVPVGVA